MATSLSIVGTDNEPPIYNPDGLWTIWSIDQIWRGLEGLNKHVAKLDDYVRVPLSYVTYIVEHVDPVTLIPTLRRITPDEGGTIDDPNQVISPGPQAFRAYYDKSVTPYRMQVDPRMEIPGSMSNYMKVFKGIDTTVTGVVISKMYNSSGDLVSENVPLELIETQTTTVGTVVTNYTRKNAVAFSVTDNLPDNELLTAVIYSPDGGVVMTQQLLVVDTTFQRTVEAQRRYITAISLKTPFLSPTDDRVIEFPLSVPVTALNLTGIVHYNDREPLELPVDGTKFQMFGLDAFSSTIIGQKLPLVLKYNMSADETSYATNGSVNGDPTEEYDLVVSNTYSSYAVKLFGYPVWVNTVTGYSMRWFLLNVDRNIWFDVTQYVSFDPTTGPFDGRAYGILQRKSVGLNLANVSQTFKNFRHTQLVDIVLYQAPGAGQTNWELSQEGPATMPYYGAGLYAKPNGLALNFGNGQSTQQAWLNKVYYATHPLINGQDETVAPTPTHFVVMYDTFSVEVPIANWNQDVPIGPTPVLTTNAYLRFIRRTTSGDLILSIAGMLVLNG